jgi:ribonuclease HII
MSGRGQYRSLHRYDLAIRQQGFGVMAGVDEAGRGPLAGPVVAAAVVLPAGAELPGTNDSKKLSPGRRQAALDRIMESALAVGVGIIDPEEIDRTDILRSALRAMGFALCGLRLKPELALIDGNRIPALPPGAGSFPMKPLVGGDSLSLSVAAASIVAKCLRDSLMDQWHARYPQYRFDRHRGYGTRVHLDALHRYGPCPLHRKTFEPVRSMLEAER